jgi:hypothetical protein
MKKENKQKKAWKKPEVQDLDVQNTASGFANDIIEQTSVALAS